VMVPLLEVLLHTDGSVTRILKRFFDNVEVNPIETVTVTVEDEKAKLLGVPDGDEVYLRRVVIEADGVPVILAETLARPDNLPGKMKREVLQSSKPLGVMIEEHELETRRVILEVFEAELQPREMGLLGIMGRETVPARRYLVIHRATPMLLITEKYNPDVLRPEDEEG